MSAGTPAQYRARKQAADRSTAACLRARYCTNLQSSKSPPKQVRHFDEKRPLVTAQTAFKLIRERAVAVVIQIIVVADIQRRARMRRPAQQELPSDARGQRVVISPRSRKGEAREIVTRAQ